MKPKTCKRGHVMSEANTYICPRGVKNCRKCRQMTHRRWRKDKSKFILLEPKSRVVDASEVPEHNAIVTSGYWKSQALQASLLEYGQAVVINTKGMFLSTSVTSAISTAASKAGAKVEPRYHEGFIYIIQRGNPK